MGADQLAAHCVRRLQEQPQSRRVTAFAAEDLTVKVTRRHKKKGRQRQEVFVLTIGRPNYRERLMLKKGVTLGYVEIQPWPVTRA